MERRELHVEVRNIGNKGESRRLRLAGKVPCIFYGPAMKEGVPLAISATELAKALAAGSNALFTLKTNGSSAVSDKMALIKDEQFHPLTSKMIHVDLYEVRMDQPIKVSIPVVLVGKPEGVAEGGILQTSLRELEVRCLPNKIPEKIEVDVSALKIGDSLHVSDLKLPTGVTVAGAIDYTVAAVVPPEKEEVAAAVAAPGEVPVVGEARAEGSGATAQAEGGAKAPAAAKGADAKAEPAKTEKKK
jgi:large subunit ribosomal protein L25